MLAWFPGKQLSWPPFLPRKGVCVCVCVGWGGVGWGVDKWEEDQTSGRRFSYFLLRGQEKARVIYKNHSCETGIFSLNTPVTPKIATFGAETFTVYCSVKSVLLTMRKKKGKRKNTYPYTQPQEPCLAQPKNLPFLRKKRIYIWLVAVIYENLLLCSFWFQEGLPNKWQVSGRIWTRLSSRYRSSWCHHCTMFPLKADYLHFRPN